MAKRPAAGRRWLSLAIAAAIGAPGALIAQPGGGPVELAPAIAEADPANHARGVFFTATLELDLPGGAALLASTPDGTGALCSDDAAELRLTGPDGVSAIWSQLFVDGRPRAIRCTPPQRLALGGAGRYTATITLTDRFAHTYSSRPYYLVPLPAAPAVMAGPAGGAAARAPGVFARPTSARAPASPTAAPPSPTLPAASSTPEPQPAPAPVAASAEPASTGSAGPWLWLAAALALCGLLVIAVARRRPAPRLGGIIDLTDRASGEARTVLLGGYPHGVAISRAPLGLAPLERRGDRPAPLCIIAGAHGPELDHGESDGQGRRVALRDGETLLIDSSLELRYRRSR